MRRRHQVPNIAAALMLLMAAASGDAQAAQDASLSPGPAREPEGKLRLVGDTSSAMLIDRVATAFREALPAVSLSTQTLGTAAPTPWWEAEASGSVALVSEPMGARETAAFVDARGYSPLSLPVAFDPVAVIVHADNPIAQLTPSQLKRIFGPGGPVRWGDLGVDGPLAERPVHPLVPDRSAPLHGYFRRRVLAPVDYGPQTERSASSRAIASAVGRRPEAIGVVPVRRLTGRVRAVPITAASEEPALVPMTGGVATEDYLLVRPLLLLADAPDAESLSTEAAAFARYLCSAPGQSVLANAGLVPLRSAQAARCVSQLPPADAFGPGSDRRQ